jgi:hypothetical protein
MRELYATAKVPRRDNALKRLQAETAAELDALLPVLSWTTPSHSTLKRQ